MSDSHDKRYLIHEAQAAPKNRKRKPMPSTDILKRIKQILRIIYSKEEAGDTFRGLKNLMDLHGRNETIIARRKKYNDQVALTERDVILITYADTIYSGQEKPLRTLSRFLEKYVQNAVSGAHILPFFPSSSDGGYAVINHKEVDPRLGTWEDIRAIAQDYRVMVDLVINHVSTKSRWFTGFLHGDKRYRNYFLPYDSRVDMPKVFRPREHPLLTEFDTAMGRKYVWTTFGVDQIDLNFKNPEVLIKMIDVMLFYLTQGVEIIRLDAIGYVWKEPNTSCVNLAKTHQIVRLLRAILEYAAPYAVIVTEVNFPYKDNVSYFGEGHEANMVYKFSLPPLVMDAFARKDTSYLRKVKKRLREDLLFFNFLASHDGIALLAAQEILEEKDFENLLEITKSHGGFISYRATDGGNVPYELNISYFDAINDPNRLNDPLAGKRFIASQAIMLALKGIPGIYVHSLLGSRNYYQGLKDTGMKRTINRETLREEDLQASLSDIHSMRYQVLHSLLHLLNARGKSPCFHPAGAMEVLDFDTRLFAVSRRLQGETVTVVVNVSDERVTLPEYKGYSDLLSARVFDGAVDPYGAYFLTPDHEGLR
jgi:glycosidase